MSGRISWVPPLYQISGGEYIPVYSIDNPHISYTVNKEHHYLIVSNDSVCSMLYLESTLQHML